VFLVRGTVVFYTSTLAVTTSFSRYLYVVCPTDHWRSGIYLCCRWCI